jgi:hypothetical protein
VAAHVSLLSVCAAPRPGIPIGRFLTSALVAGVVLSGVAFACFSAFICVVPYDDEGVVLLFVQHMLDGHAIYDRVNCLYGPFYLFARWLVFGVLHVPVGNDALRVETLITWLATTLLLAMTTWRLARGFAWQMGLGTLVWVLSLCQLFVFSREPGHPQEIVALLVAAALFVAVTMEDRLRATSVALLGGIGAAIILTKVNVGVFYGLALTISLLTLTSRSSRFWFVLRCAVACATVVVPGMLMKSRFTDGYAGFCFLVTSALLPGVALACFNIRSGTMRLAEILWGGLGAALVACPMAAFVLWQGNTISGMVNAIFLRTWRNFASTPVGTPMPVSVLEMVWAAVATVFGLVVLWRTQSSFRLLWPLRIVACVMIFLIAASRNHEVFVPVSLGLPLVWLLLVPPAGHELDERNWFFRLFLCFTAYLQPLQIFPVTGSQVLIGTLVLPIVAVVLALDVCQEARDLARSQPLLFATRLTTLKRLTVIAIALASMRPRAYEAFGGEWMLPSITSVWALLAAGMGLAALKFEPSVRKFLLPLKVILCGSILLGMLTAPPWDMTWLRLTLPLCWLILIQPPSQAVGETGAYVRLGLVAAACLDLVHLLPVVHFVGRPFHFAIFLMVAIDIVLLMDVGRELGLVERLRAGAWALDVKANTVLLMTALLVGLVSMIDAVEEYRSLFPLDLPGCHWVRMPERDAAFCTFLATNVRRSSDCVFARFGLESLHFWAEQRPASDIVPISNLWAQMDPISDERLLRAHEHCARMLFIDNPNPWNRVPPKMKFLDFIASHFQLLGRLGPTRLLVRKERTDLALYDCAFQPRSLSGGSPNPILFLQLPTAPKLQGVAVVDLVDLSRNPGHELLKSTAGSALDCLKLVDGAGHLLLPNASGTIDIANDQSLRILLPGKTDLSGLEFPALRFLDARGQRILTLPVIIDAAPLSREFSQTKSSTRAGLDGDVRSSGERAVDSAA